MASFNKVEDFALEVGKGTHALHTATLKVMLTNTAPSASNKVKTDVTEISAGNGYTAGGNTATFTSFTQTAGVAKLVLADPAAWTAAGGTVGPFRYAVIYNDTATSKNLIGYWDYGSAVTLNVGETFTVDLDGVAGVLTIQ